MRDTIFQRIGVVLCSLVLTASASLVLAQSPTETLTIDAKAPAQPFPHFWEQMFGSGRAVLTLRDSYRQDLREVKGITGFRYVRFHAIFHDELGVYDEDAQGNAVYNFSYVDQIYDGLLANGVKPFVEISFMPKKLASRMDYHAFWYKQVVSPPKDYDKWDALIKAFAQHLVDRYGVEEVGSWYFEVWNEPNIDFWTGVPARQTYFELYDHTARALKGVSPKIRVGGPATAQAAWVKELIQHASTNHVPLDFVSTHVYGNDSAKDVFGDDRPIAPHQMVCAAVSKVHDEILASSSPKLPLIWSEFNATYTNDPQITDSIYMGPWMAETISKCDGLVDIMSYWSFSDVFEEQGVVKQPFYGGYGLIAAGGIPKPAFYAFELLHALGTNRIALPQKNVLATRREDGALVIAAWNLVEPGVTGDEITLQLNLQGISSAATAHIRRVDAQHGNTVAVYNRIGKPTYPTRAQILKLRGKSALDSGETKALAHGALSVKIPPDGLVTIEVR